MQRFIPNVMTVAGVDPSGGAGVLADIKTFSALGAYGCGVITSLTAQNTCGVAGIHTPPSDFLRLQFETLFADVEIHALKIGMLGKADIVATVAQQLAKHPLASVVCDPVMVAQSGDVLLESNAIALYREALFPQVSVITPNLPEAGALLEQRPPDNVKEMHRAAEHLRDLLPLSSPRWVLLKGGHLPGNELVDLLFDGDRMLELPSPRIETHNTHGTGCTLSAALAALLPRHGGEPNAVEKAVLGAREYLQAALVASDQLKVGKGCGPVHHFYRL